MPRQCHTQQGNPKVPSGHRLVVEREIQGLHYYPFSHVHILAFHQVEYGARGFVGLQTHVYGAKHPKGNKMEYSRYICSCNM